MARQLKEEEVQNRFLDHVWNMIQYWENEERQPTIREKLEGLAFSILTALDGGTELPSFAVIPLSTEEDRDYYRDQGENWYPISNVSDEDCDIAGGLHEHFYSRNPRNDQEDEHNGE